MSLSFFGLDGEMSGADLAAGGRLIQIGLAAHAGPDGSPAEVPELFSSLLNPGEMTWEPRAAAVHGYTIEEVLAAPPAEQVDAACVEWLAGQGIDQPRRAIAVGFNVGTFDLPHLAAVLPRTALLFARRSIDLNAVCFTLEGLDYQGTRPAWSGWKRMASTYAERVIASTAGSSEVAHDAGYDALLHLHGWRFLRAASHGQPLAMPQEAVGGYAKDVRVATGVLLARVGLDEAVALTGFTGDQLKGWSNGGRVTDPVVLPVLLAALGR